MGTTMKPNLHFAGLVLAAAALGAHAQEFKHGRLTISQPHARATAPGQTAGGGYLKLHNNGPADRLVAASAAVSNTVELHSMTMEGDVMRMRQLDAIELPAGTTVELKPGGLHLMLMGLKAPLKPGDSFAMKLKFEKAGEVAVQAKVRTADGGAHGMKH
jgi:periplasmic copper chaperone A